MTEIKTNLPDLTPPKGEEEPDEESKRTLCEVYSRVSGYMRPVSGWNDAKQDEFKLRKTYKVK